MRIPKLYSSLNLHRETHSQNLKFRFMHPHQHLVAGQINTERYNWIRIKTLFPSWCLRKLFCAEANAVFDTCTDKIGGFVFGAGSVREVCGIRVDFYSACTVALCVLIQRLSGGACERTEAEIKINYFILPCSFDLSRELSDNVDEE